MNLPSLSAWTPLPRAAPGLPSFPPPRTRPARPPPPFVGEVVRPEPRPGRLRRERRGQRERRREHEGSSSTHEVPSLSSRTSGTLPGFDFERSAAEQAGQRLDLRLEGSPLVGPVDELRGPALAA